MLSADYPVRVICDVLDIARSSYYYVAVEPVESSLRSAIEAVAVAWPTYGSRRVTAQLRREIPDQTAVGRKRVRRLMGEMGLKVKVKKRCHQTTNSRHGFPRYENLVKDLEVTRPDQVWVCDITYIKLGNREFVYLAIVMDIFTRAIRGWELGRGLGVELTLGALGQAFQKGKPEIHHSDQGVQYAATDYVEALEKVGAQISMAAVGHAEENGYAERVIRTIKEEEVELNEYSDYEDARLQIGSFIDEVYLTKRIHSSLGYLTPAEFEAQWLKEQAASILKIS
jgi:putative transposase